MTNCTFFNYTLALSLLKANAQKLPRLLQENVCNTENVSILKFCKSLDPVDFQEIWTENVVHISTTIWWTKNL